MEEDGEEDDEEGEDEEEEEEPEPVIIKELPKRSTRGQRMNALVGKAIEEDEQFWNSGIFAGAAEENAEGSDESYNSKEESASAGQDSFDSDFDRPD